MKRFAPVIILGFLSYSGLLGNLFKDLIMLIQKYIRLG